MNVKIRERIFSELLISNDNVLNEMACLMAYNKLAEFTADVEYFEKKYKKTFEDFENDIKKKKGILELENDWLSWSFSLNGKKYWHNIINEMNNDNRITI